MQPYPQPAQQPGALAASPTAQPPALAPGTILLDRYLIQGYINGGGFGHIYKALDNALGYRRAIKEAFYQDPQTRQQFHLEAEFLINVRHPNLVAGYAVFEQEGRLYLVMDYVDGHTLEEIAIDQIRRTGRPLTEAQILDWVLPVCGALHALHESPKPVIHRDVKPANIKVNRQGVPVLIDLGLAKLFARGTTTIGAALAFTPGYAPPEQYRATGATDARTDVYGMGATLFYLLTGYQPTEAPARLGSLAVPPLRQLNPAISPLTEAAVIRAMELLPESRQQSAFDLQRDLRAARAALASFQQHDPSSLRVQPDVNCGTCGTSNPAAARHCTRCGTPLSDAIALATTGDGTDWLRALPGQVASTAEAVFAPQLAQRDRAAPHTPMLPGHQQLQADSAKASGTPVDAAHLSGSEPARWPVESPGVTDPEAVVPADARAAFAPAPSSEPDQPAIAMPPLRRGPAPAAKPLGQSGSEPGAWGKRRPEPRATWRARPAMPSASAGGVARAAAMGTALPAALWSYAVPSLRRWHAETASAATPLDDTEVRLSLAGVMSLVLAVCTLLSVRSPQALVLAIPALALGHWCHGAATNRAIAEARWLATLGLAITYAWLGLYVAGWLVLRIHGWL